MISYTTALCAFNVALRPGVAPAHVEGCLGDFASLALGYPMQATLEAMEHADLDPPRPVLDSVSGLDLPWGGRGVGLLSLFDYKRSMGLLICLYRPHKKISTRTTCSAHHGRMLAPPAGLASRGVARLTAIVSNLHS